MLQQMRQRHTLDTINFAHEFRRCLVLRFFLGTESGNRVKDNTRMTAKLVAAIVLGTLFCAGTLTLLYRQVASLESSIASSNST
jgi:hypothetical protein